MVYVECTPTFAADPGKIVCVPSSKTEGQIKSLRGARIPSHPLSACKFFSLSNVRFNISCLFVNMFACGFVCHAFGGVTL